MPDRTFVCCVLFLAMTALVATASAETRQTAAGTYYLYRPSGSSSAPMVVFEVLAEGGVDHARILLVGYSAGGSAAYDFGTNNADCYDAMACVHCYMPQGAVALSGRLPILLLESEGDPNLPAARQAEQYLKNADFDVTMKVLPGGSHAYQTDVASPTILDWFEGKIQPAQTNPNGDRQAGTTTDDDGQTGTSTDDGGTDGTSANEGGTTDETGTTGTSANGTTPNGTSTDENGHAGTSATATAPAPISPNAGGTPMDTATAAPPPLPIVNGYGIAVGGLTDGEIEGLIRRWLDSVWKPSQSPPSTEGGWRLDDWGIWVNGNISHVGGIDGYGSIFDFWMKTSEACRQFVQSTGTDMHPQPAADEHAPTTPVPTATLAQGPASTAETRPNAPSSDSGSGTGSGTGTASSPTTNGSGTSEPVPDLNAPNDATGNAPTRIDGRPLDVYVPDGYRTADGKQWGLVVALSGIAGNTQYLKEKLQQGCTKHRCVFVGLKAKNATGSTFGFRWENDEAENLGFIAEAVRQLEQSHGLAPNRTYAVGFSNGGYFLGRAGSGMDDTFEGFVMCEGGDFIGSSDKQVRISGSDAIDSSRSGNRWSAYCQGMGHKFPGQALPMYQDPGVTTSADGLAVDGAAILEWLSQ